MKLRFVLVAMVGLLVTACSKNVYEVTISPCPALAIVGDVGTLTRFAGNGRDTQDVAFTATATNAEISCTAEGSVVSTVTFDLIAKAGPALKSNNETISYFVAVMKDNHVIVTKKIYNVNLRFGGNNSRVELRQSIQNVIPTLDQAQHYDYEILIGLQLTPDEAAYNIAR